MIISQNIQVLWKFRRRKEILNEKSKGWCAIVWDSRGRESSRMNLSKLRTVSPCLSTSQEPCTCFLKRHLAAFHEKVVTQVCSGCFLIYWIVARMLTLTLGNGTFCAKRGLCLALLIRWSAPGHSQKLVRPVHTPSTHFEVVVSRYPDRHGRTMKLFSIKKWSPPNMGSVVRIRGNCIVTRLHGHTTAVTRCYAWQDCCTLLVPSSHFRVHQIRLAHGRFQWKCLVSIVLSWSFTLPSETQCANQQHASPC